MFGSTIKGEKEFSTGLSTQAAASAMYGKLNLMFVPIALALLALQSPMMRNLPPRTALLTYHDMLESRGPTAEWFDCTTAEFEAQLDWLKHIGVHFVTLDQLYSHLTRGTNLPSRPVAITFADNYQGFWLRAYPVLKARHIPCAMFVHTGYVGDRAHGRPKMDWAELRVLDREGLVTIGSQTVSHPADLRLLNATELRNEMVDSKAKLEQELGHPILYLAYPNGKFNTASMKAARSAGYVMAFCEETHPAELSSSIFAVNRYVHTKYRRAMADIHATK
jgi:peptidoglycan/xylan/chitin deacetylase (PgdA/CDA1 family)